MAVASKSQWLKTAAGRQYGEAGYSTYLSNMAKLGQHPTSSVRSTPARPSSSGGGGSGGNVASFNQWQRDKPEYAHLGEAGYNTYLKNMGAGAKPGGDLISGPQSSASQLTQSRPAGTLDYGSYLKSVGMDPSNVKDFKGGTGRYREYLRGSSNNLASSRNLIGQAGAPAPKIRWKPRSEKDGKLVVLAGGGGNYQIVDRNGKIVENGRSYGASNGYGNTVRFSKPGSAYQGMYLKIGNQVYDLGNAGQDAGPGTGRSLNTMGSGGGLNISGPGNSAGSITAPEGTGGVRLTPSNDAGGGRANLGRLVRPGEKISFVDHNGVERTIDNPLGYINRDQNLTIYRMGLSDPAGNPHYKYYVTNEDDRRVLVHEEFGDGSGNGDDGQTPIPPAAPSGGGGGHSEPPPLPAYDGNLISSGDAEPYTREVVAPAEQEDYETVRGQITDLLDSGSRYIERARHFGREAAASRGLLNSSLSAQAAEAAAIDAGLPIASQDASTYFTQASNNQNAVNRFRLAELENAWKMQQLELQSQLGLNSDLATLSADHSNRLQLGYLEALNNMYTNPYLTPQQQNSAAGRIASIYGRSSLYASNYLS